MKEIALINGPNLNLLGTREPELYGRKTLDDIVESLAKHAAAKGFGISHTQSNSEGSIINAIQEAASSGKLGLIINPAAYSHTSISIRDAISSTKLPTIEVHLSNIYRRESFRQLSYVSQVANGVISGMGDFGYILAFEALSHLLERAK